MASELKNTEWSDRVVRHLRSTILVDSGKSVSFVPERSHRTEDLVTESSLESPEGALILTGEEASEFYEEVLSLPQQCTRVVEAVSRTVHDWKCGKQSSKLKRKVQQKKRVAQKKSNIKAPGYEVNSFKLFQYAQENEVDLLQSALSSGHFDVDMQDNFHWTLLMVAAYAGHVTIVECLLERGAKWQEYTSRGMNAADLARSRGHTGVADLIESFDSREEGEEEEGEELLGGSSVGKKKRNSNFYCDSCRTVVNQSPKAGHDTSIMHLYSGQHRTSSLVPYMIPQSNRGFQMLLRSGWNPRKGLGPHRQGHKFPVKTVLKQDRLGFGVPGGKAKVTHFSAHDREAVRSHRDRHKKEKQPSKNKKEILQEKHHERQWEKRIRTIMNHEDSHLFT